MDRVELTGLTLDAVVGILPRERVSPQPMILDVELHFPLGPIAVTGDLGLGVDYAAVEAQLTALAQEGRFWLIETFALAAVRWLLLPPTADEHRGQVERAVIRVRKPAILDGRAVPGVLLEREAPPAVQSSTRNGCEVTRLVRTERDGAWRVRLAAGSRFEPGPDQALMVVAGSVAGADGVLEMGARHQRGRGAIEAVGGACTLLVAGSPVGERPLGA